MPQPNQPHSSPTHAESELIYEGLGKHSAYIGGYAKWVMVLIVGITVGILLMKIDALSQYPLWLLGLVGLPGMLLVFLRHRTTRFKITYRRVEYERGILNRLVDGMELWRVLDVRYNQTIFDRLTGNGRITLIGTDKSDPELVLYGLPKHRELFGRLQDAVQAARQRGRPMELVGQGDFVEDMGGNFHQ
ncbi:MAG: PH domain-containing protein [Myxococcales bacterium]|nr:PH domain-containing protein [Myxococcales bacterium]MCB9716613.1 PH domain-containing protein [Myxococcales bacterium]